MTNLFAHNFKIDVAIMTKICTPSTSRTSILDLLQQADLRENILLSGLIYLYRICGMRSLPHAITKTGLGDATRTMVTVVPLQVQLVTRREGKKKKKVMPDLGWRIRGQRFLPACRPEKTYVFLRYDHGMLAPSHYLFANRSRPIAEGHAPRWRWQRRRRRQRVRSRQASRPFSKILYRQRADTHLVHLWEYPIELENIWSSQVDGMRWLTYSNPPDNQRVTV